MGVMDGSAIGAVDFAYKYPFSSEAREIVAQSHAAFDPAMLRAGKRRLEEALQSGSIAYAPTGLSEVKYAHVMSYVYARMLVSAMNSRAALTGYVNAEAKRSADALVEDTDDNVLHLAAELGIRMDYDSGTFRIGFEKFLALSPKTPDLSLVHQDLGNGVVSMQRYKAARVMERAMAAEISKKLPIPLKELPIEAVQLSKSIKMPAGKIEVRINKAKYTWIAKLLANPIGDVRHRTTNLILAPYLVNVQGLSEDDAAKVIVDYIERCKQVEPNTKVNESYIKYQCRYAKAHGTKPMSYDRAKELLKDVVALE